MQCNHRTAAKARSASRYLRQSIALGLTLLATQLASAATPCTDAQICGLGNSEDAVRLGTTHWAIATRLERDPAMTSGFYLIDLQARRASELVTDDTRPADPRFKACPGPMDPKKLVTHGLDVHWLSPAHGELYAVNHGGRESIEVYDLRLASGGAHMQWIGCVVIPADTLTNAVAFVPGGMAVTSFGQRDDKDLAKLRKGEPSGFVAMWSPAAGWHHLPNTQFAGNNGIAWNAGDNTLYVNGWGDGTLHVVPLRPGAAASTIKLTDIHPDNAHFLPDGSLLIAGQTGNPDVIMGCGLGPVCPMDSNVVLFDVHAKKVIEQISAKATPTFGAASTAILFDHQYWGTSFGGDRAERLGASHQP